MTDLNPAVNISVTVGPGTYEHHIKDYSKGTPRLPQGQPVDYTPKPSVGRIVHYWHTLVEPWAAIVTRVETGTDAHLAVFWAGAQNVGDFLYDTPKPFSKEPQPGHWSWPPRA